MNKQPIKKALFINNREPYPENIFDPIDNVEMIWCQNVSDPFPLEKIVGLYNETEILVTTFFDLNATILAKLPNLKLILSIATETSFIDKDYCQQKNIKIVNTPNYTGASVAEHAVALLFAAAKRIVDFNQKVRTGDFQVFEHQGIELYHKKAGIIGMGSIGEKLARILKGLGMEVLYYNRSLKQTDVGIQVGLDALLSESDVVFLTLPLNEASVGMLDTKAFAIIKKGAILINTSPDSIVEFSAFKSALESGRLSYAAVDLLSEDVRYFQLPNLIITPRRAWYTKESFERRIGIFTKLLALHAQVI
jgi:lactate dehydrogenase-like 2-hydroxyacid dehydrogenase